MRPAFVIPAFEPGSAFSSYVEGRQAPDQVRGDGQRGRFASVNRSYR